MTCQEIPGLAEWFSYLLNNQRGQIGDAEADNSDEGSPEDIKPIPGGDKADDTPDFIKPIDGLPDALKGEWEKHRKGMQRSYTKTLEKLRAKEVEIAAQSKKFGDIDRFYNDPSFAEQIVTEWAKQNNRQITGGTSSTTPDVPANILKQVEDSLPQELKWIAPHIAKAQMVAIQPFTQQYQQQDQARRTTEVDTILEELSESDPGWEEYEDDLLELLDFFRSDTLKHKRFGSKPKLLLALLTGNGNAIKEATNRMRQAAKHKGTTPVSASGQSNLEDRVKKAVTSADAWKIAKAHALKEHGVKVEE